MAFSHLLALLFLALLFLVLFWREAFFSGETSSSLYGDLPSCKCDTKSTRKHPNRRTYCLLTAEPEKIKTLLPRSVSLTFREAPDKSLVVKCRGRHRGGMNPTDPRVQIGPDPRSRPQSTTPRQRPRGELACEPVVRESRDFTIFILPYFILHYILCDNALNQREG